MEDDVRARTREQVDNKQTRSATKEERTKLGKNVAKYNVVPTQTT